MQQWSDEAGCAQAAALLALQPRLGEARIELQGPLGAGKTTFARHLLRALGVTGRVKSPTYGLLEIYRSALGTTGADRLDVDRLDFDIHHFDFYRFDDPQEWEDAGFRDIFAGPGLKLTEWPERAAGLLPPADLSIRLEPLDGEPPSQAQPRRVRFDALSPLGRELLR